MARAPYESDLTKFMRELLRERPHIVEEQRRGRAMWWDRKLDFEELRRQKESAVKQKGYAYQPDS